MSNEPLQLDRKKIIDENFIRRVQERDFPKAKSSPDLLGGQLSKERWVDLFESQIISRQLDFIARDLKESNQSFYTIGSSGHEGNAVLGHYFSLQDTAFLHYRSGAFMAQRSKKDPQNTFIRDCLLSLMASEQDPISAGRHKVWGSVALNIPPQTSTIASHLPKALGYAYSTVLDGGRPMDKADVLSKPEEAKTPVVLCSFGDASFNHSTSQGAFNGAQYLAYSNVPLPLIFVCEDNGIGISVPTPGNWIEDNVKGRTHLHYVVADGLNMADVYRACEEAEHFARAKQQPVFMHIKTVRLMGHAGSDIESVYRRRDDILLTEADDPLLHSARLLVEAGYLTTQEILHRYQCIHDEVALEAKALVGQQGLNSVEAIQQSLYQTVPHSVPPSLVSQDVREKRFAGAFKKITSKRTLAQQINAALTDLMLQYDSIVVYGEDVGVKGGVYHVTADLQKRFGQGRVIDSFLDETSLLGMAIGMGMQKRIPIPEIQFLAYTHNAIDQLRGEAATLSFFSDGQYQNPMVIRIASMAYQKGFGGHFHNENAIAFLREIPGIIVACPSNGSDAAKMLRSCVEQAHCYGRVVVFLEPIALYSAKDLHCPGDGLWLRDYPDPDEKIVLNDVGIFGEGKDLLIISYGNGYYLSRQAEQILKNQHELACTVMDLRWLAPLAMEAILKSANNFDKILIVDECRKTGSISEELYTRLSEETERSISIKRLTAEDCFITLGKSWQHLLPSSDAIVREALGLI